MAKLQARTWSSRALCAPGQHTAIEDEESARDNRVLACNFAEFCKCGERTTSDDVRRRTAVERHHGASPHHRRPSTVWSNRSAVRRTSALGEATASISSPRPSCLQPLSRTIGLYPRDNKTPPAAAAAVDKKAPEAVALLHDRPGACKYSGVIFVFKYYYSAPDSGTEYCDDRVCLSAIISSELHVRSSRIFLYMLPMAVARSSSGDMLCDMLRTSGGSGIMADVIICT